MVISFKHKGLQKFYESGSTAGIQNDHKTKLRMILAALDSAQEIDDMKIPGYKLHPLKGKLKGLWSVTVNGNWRVTFRFENGNVYIVNYEDYH
jgi:proteic killer suppression protein